MDSALNGGLTLACGLEVEEQAARDGGAEATRVGLGATLPLPAGRLVSFGLAGGLVPGLEPGTLLSARKIVDEEGRTLWEGEPAVVPGALHAVICSVGAVVNEPSARQALAERTGAVAVDMESGPLAASGRLVGVVRAVSDSAERPVCALACAAKRDGEIDWAVVAKAFLTEPLASARTALAGRRGLASLRHAATAFAEDARG